MVAIAFRGVSKLFDGNQVLADVDLQIASGALTVLVGPSGAGKSLLLRMIAGLEHPDAGTVTVGDQTVGQSGAAPHGVAMVFQHDALYEHLEIAGNLRFPLEVTHTDPTRVHSISRRSARRMGISGLWRRRPRTLSSGERGMAAVARAISREGLSVLLLDEPLTGADRSARHRFRLELRRLHESEGLTTVVATNDQEEAMALADVLVILMDGVIAQSGSPRAVFESPDTTAVASFLGALPMNLFPGEIHDDVVEIAGDRLEIGPVPGLEGVRVVVGIHPHELDVAYPGTPFGRTLHGTVSRVEDLGSTRNVLFGLGRSPAGTFVMTDGRSVDWRPGDRLELTWPPDRLRLFRADTGQAISR